MSIDLSDKEYYAKGKRGVVSLANWNGTRVLVKEHNPSSAVDTIAHEAMMMKKLNALGIGPKFFAYEKNMLIREFIDGEEISEWVVHAKSDDIRHVLVLLLLQCQVMDVASIDKTEMNHPTKHILIRKNIPVQIDFERSRISTRPKNVTQICQWFTNSGFAKQLMERDVRFDVSSLRSLARQYKRTYDPVLVDQMIGLLNTSSNSQSPKNKKARKSIDSMSFAEQVYALVRKVPKGKVTTYKDLAHALNSGAYRAVGQALRCNPYAPQVPCHRVVASNGSLGGFNGAKDGPDIQRKIALLNSEGVRINDGQVVDFAKKRHTFTA